MKEGTQEFDFELETFNRLFTNLRSLFFRQNTFFSRP
jgi:hypothetical protein